MMKNTLLSLATLCCLGNATAFAIEIPKSLRTVAELDKAKSDATARKKPIAVLYSDKSSTCPYTIGGTMDAIKAFRTKTVMVYVNRGEHTSLPANVQSAIASVGSFPRTVIMDASLTNVIATVPYSSDPAKQQKTFREATKKIHEGAAGKTAAAASTDAFGSFFNKPAQ